MSKRVRDYFGKEQERREDLLFQLIQHFRSRKYRSLQTPLFEEASVLLGKRFTQRDLEQVYGFTQLDGTIVFRYEHTRPLARFIVENSQHLDFPLKCYQTGSVLRREEASAGKLDEFIQFDADIVGHLDNFDFSLLIQDLLDVFQFLSLGEIVLRISHSSLFNQLMIEAGIPADEATIIRLQLAKLSSTEEARRYLELIITERIPNQRSKEEFRSIIFEKHEGLLHLAESNELRQISLQFQTIREKIKFAPMQSMEVSPVMVRGNGYYTGLIFEIHATSHGDLGALAGGGNYSTLISRMGGERVEGFGGSLGFDRIMNALDRNVASKLTIF